MFASYLLDLPSQVRRDLKVIDPGVRFWAFFTFVQDKWAVTPKLTVDLGLRHEHYTPFIGLVDQGGLSNYDPTTNTLQVAGYGNVSQSVGVQSYWKNFGPRAGLSYRIDDLTVVRGGYGLSTLPSQRMAPVTGVIPTDVSLRLLEIGLQATKPSPYHAGPATPQPNTWA